jgi:hypothetical protein
MISVTNFDDPAVINPLVFSYILFFILLMFIARGVLYFYVCMAIGCTTVKEKRNKRDFVLSWV